MKSGDHLQNRMQNLGKEFLRFRVPLFLLLVVAVYGFVVWRIDVLQTAPPPASAVAAKLQSTTHIDQATVSKIKQLQDNSVSVRALFNQARQNPFQE